MNVQQPTAPLATSIYPVASTSTTDTEKQLQKPLDDVDFSSGYETQYKKEYRPIRQREVSPPDPKTFWYRDWRTILMMLILLAVLLAGSVVLIRLVFTTTPWKVAAITGSYIMVAIFVIYVEVKSVHVR